MFLNIILYYTRKIFLINNLFQQIIVFSEATAKNESNNPMAFKLRVLVFDAIIHLAYSLKIFDLFEFYYLFALLQIETEDTRTILDQHFSTIFARYPNQ